MNDNHVFAKEVHHQVKRKFPRRQVVVTGLDEIWAMDLASMESFSGDNDGYRYILCVIDVFSKFAWCIPLKNKTGQSILTSVQSIIKNSKRQPEKIWVDRGSEFYNKIFQTWANKENIVIYSTYGESKSVVVERFIRTLKEMITRQFTSKNSRNWIKILPDVLHEYNNRVHRTIKMTPTQASDAKNEVSVYTHIHHHSPRKNNKPQFKVGDSVRISRLKGTFEKGYQPNFSYEVFTVSNVLDTNPTTYKLADYNGDIIDGSFYNQELLKTSVPDHYEVEKVLGKRKVGKKVEYLVKFFGWPSKFNEYVPADQIKNIE